MKERHGMKWGIALALLLALTLIVSGCSSNPDSKEDPLAQFGVAADLPFATKSPEAATPSPTPAVTATAEPTIQPVDQSWQDEESDLTPGDEDETADIDDEEPAEPTKAPTKKPTAKPTDDEEDEAEFVQLQSGDTGTRVTRLQKRLIRLGYLSGSADGSYGSKTAAAVKRFQEAVGLKQTGVATVSLQRKLFASGAPKYVPDETVKPTAKPTATPAAYVKLQYGDTGDRVKKLQSRLKKLGYFGGEVKGNYLEQTQAAVKKFQKAIGVEQTGVASVSLQKKLFAADAPKYQAPKPTATPEDEGTFRKLRSGDSGAAVKRLQLRLKDLGYLDAEATGNYQSKTVTAVKRFQKAVGMEQNGVASIKLQEKLFSEDAPSYQPEPTKKPEESEYKKLKPGASGDAVKRLQKRLKDLGYFTGNVAGNYQTKTTAAVKKFQKAIGVEQDGIATVALQEKLFADDAPKYQEEGETQYSKLQYGDTGTEVKNLQKRLKALGYFDGDIGGNYLKKTQAAVELFQQAIGVEVDGIATAELQERIFADDAPSYNRDA